MSVASMANYGYDRAGETDEAMRHPGTPCAPCSAQAERVGYVPGRYCADQTRYFSPDLIGSTAFAAAGEKPSG